MRLLILLSLFLFPNAYAVEDSKYILSFDMLGVMEHILYPAAAVIWSNAGFVITEDGEQDLSPTTEDDWHNVEDHAAMIMESANLLILPDRGPQDIEWVELSQGLVDTGRLAFDAAQARNAEALFNAGGEIYQACLACHKRYLISHE